jgi:hypothetical protein
MKLPGSDLFFCGTNAFAQTRERATAALCRDLTNKFFQVATITTTNSGNDQIISPERGTPASGSITLA